MKGLNVIASIVAFLKSDSLSLSSRKSTSLVEVEAPDTPNSSVTDPACSTLIEFSVRLL